MITQVKNTRLTIEEMINTGNINNLSEKDDGFA